MKMKRIYVAALLSLSAATLWAQQEMDAYRYSPMDLNGTARSIGMGGAFGALGGDMSAMSHNPAGIAVYRSSELQTTLALTRTDADATWTGVKDSKSLVRMRFDNFSYVGYVPTGYDSGIKAWNFGVAYTRVRDFNRAYHVTGRPTRSLADYAAMRTSTAREQNGRIFGLSEDKLAANSAYNDLTGDWLSVLGYKAGFFGTRYKDLNDVYGSSFGAYNSSGIWTSNSPSQSTMEINESGQIVEYNFSGSMNISDRVFLGATVAVTDITYHLNAAQRDDFGANNYAALQNALETDGSGYSINLGAIIRPIDELRLGVAYNSPKWYRMTDYYYASAQSYSSADAKNPLMSSSTPQDKGSFSYAFRSPDRWIFSLAGVVGQTALLSLDYELTDYRKMRLGNRDDDTYYSDITQQAERDFKVGQTLKLGAEYRVTPQFSVRAGYVWQASPMQGRLTAGGEIFTSGTVTHYSTVGTANTYTVGLGYRFTPNFYVDLACLYRSAAEQLHPFSDLPITDASRHLSALSADVASTQIKTTRTLLTFGYRF